MALRGRPTLHPPERQQTVQQVGPSAAVLCSCQQRRAVPQQNQHASLTRNQSRAVQKRPGPGRWPR